MTKYQCKNCGYKFEADNKPDICPYCGKKGEIAPVPTADDLLKEVKEDSKDRE